jgi:hypothetical protein
LPPILFQTIIGIHSALFKHFSHTHVPATHHFTHHAIPCRRLLVLFLVQSNVATISRESSNAPMGTVAFGTSSFPHQVVLSMKSYEDSGESMKIGWIGAPGVSSVLRMIFRGLRCAIGPPFPSCKHFIRCASAVLHTTSYVCTSPHVLGWVVLMTMAYCPALWSVDAVLAHPRFPIAALVGV